MFQGQVAEVLYNGSDVEASNFADQIALVLQKANWKVPEPEAMLKNAHESYYDRN